MGVKMNSLIDIRRILTSVEDIYHENGPAPDKPLRRGAIAVVLRNPFAGYFEPNILPMMDQLNAVGLEMAGKLLAALEVDKEEITSYGKGAIIGADGELEHGALWHVPGGYAMRELLGWKGDRASYMAGGGVSPKGVCGSGPRRLNLSAENRSTGPAQRAIDDSSCVIPIKSELIDIDMTPV